jgi:hypothetical protein
MFYFQTAVEKPSSPMKTYRNPIYLAKEYNGSESPGDGFAKFNIVWKMKIYLKIPKNPI